MCARGDGEGNGATVGLALWAIAKETVSGMHDATLDKPTNNVGCVIGG